MPVTGKTSFAACALLSLGCKVERPPIVEHEVRPPSPELQVLVEHAVLGAGESWKFDGAHELPTSIARYCKETGLTTELVSANRVATLSCGPILSRFEGDLVAALFAGTATEKLVGLGESVDAEPYEAIPATYERTLIDVSAGKVLGQHLAIALWGVQDQDAERKRLAIELEADGLSSPPESWMPMNTNEGSRSDWELFVLSPAGPRFIARNAWLDSFTSSGGLALVVGPQLGSPAFIEVVGASRAPERKTESIRVWRAGDHGHDVLFEVQSLSWSRDEAGAELTVTRVVPAPKGLDLVTYDVRLSWLPAVKETSGELFRSKATYPPDVAEIRSIDKTSTLFVSLVDLAAGRARAK